MVVRGCSVEGYSDEIYVKWICGKPHGDAYYWRHCLSHSVDYVCLQIVSQSPSVHLCPTTASCEIQTAWWDTRHSCRYARSCHQVFEQSNDRAFSADECPLAMRWTIFGTRIERQFCYRDRCSASFSLQHCVLFGSNDNSSHSSSFPGQLEASWRSSRFQCWKKWN